MTAEALELKKKLDENISQFREKELQKMYEFSQFLLFTLSSSIAKENEPAKPEQLKKVLYNGKWLTEATVKLMTWHKPTTDTDEEVEDKIWEYLQEKHGKL